MSLSGEAYVPRFARERSEHRKVKVELPKQLPSRLTTLQKACTEALFEANPANCPAASVVGNAMAVTPIIPVPLTGPAYFVSHGAKVPELIAVLQGYGVTIDLDGETFISQEGITTSTFKSVPDVPRRKLRTDAPAGQVLRAGGKRQPLRVDHDGTVKKKETIKVKGSKQTVTRKVKETKPGTLAMPTEFVAQNGAKINERTRSPSRAATSERHRNQTSITGSHKEQG